MEFAEEVAGRKTLDDAGNAALFDRQVGLEMSWPHPYCAGDHDIAFYFLGESASTLAIHHYPHLPI